MNRLLTIRKKRASVGNLKKKKSNIPAYGILANVCGQMGNNNTEVKDNTDSEYPP